MNQPSTFQESTFFRLRISNKSFLNVFINLDFFVCLFSANACISGVSVAIMLFPRRRFCRVTLRGPAFNGGRNTLGDINWLADCPATIAELVFISEAISFLTADVHGWQFSILVCGGWMSLSSDGASCVGSIDWLRSIVLYYRAAQNRRWITIITVNYFIIRLAYL